jgi:hypothetical protein
LIISEDGDLGLEEPGIQVGHDLGDQDLGAVMLDVGFVQHVLVLDPVLARRIKDFFLDHGVDRELGADLAGQLLLALIVLRLLEPPKKVFHHAVVLLDEGYGVGLRAARHAMPPWVSTAAKRSHPRERCEEPHIPAARCAQDSGVE